MRDKLQNILKNLIERRITGQQLNELFDWYLKIYSSKYASLSPDRIKDTIQESLQSFIKAPRTPSKKEQNHVAYFETAISNKFRDYFRNQPDGRMYERIKDILNTDTFKTRDSGIKEKNKINWNITYWQPSVWPEGADRILLDEVEHLQSKAVSFMEAGIELDRNKEIVHTDSIIAYIVHLFEYAEILFNKRVSIRAAEIKEIICNKLWIVPQNPSSISDKKSVGDSSDRQEIDPFDNTADASTEDILAHLSLEQWLYAHIRKDPENIQLWLLYQRAIKTGIGSIDLEKLLKNYPGLPQRKKSTLSNELNKLNEYIDKELIDFDGANDVIIQILGEHFSKYYSTDS